MMITGSLCFSTNNNSITTNIHITHPSVQLHPHRRFLISSSPLNDHLVKSVNLTQTPTSNFAAMAYNIASTSTPTFTDTDTVKGWRDFADKVSGEWDGFGAEFTTDGKPVELPESVVPEAYREWEVKVFDWQTQCPTLAQLLDDDSPSLTYKTIKLLPTVGCEADAATRYSIYERDITQHSSSTFAYQYSSGCYVAVWHGVNGESLEIEHCLVHPRDKESRVRIIQVVRLRDSQFTLLSIKVFVEKWYGPFRNGDQLGGCAIRDSAFAATQPLDPTRLIGIWQASSEVAAFHTSQKGIQQVGDELTRQLVREEGEQHQLICLPRQLWCSVRTGKNEEIYCEVGWLLDEGRAITSKCTFSSTAKLKEISIANETASV